MMFLHELPDYKDLILIIADEKEIPPLWVEKDYWIMHAIWGLQQQNFSFDLKGGTSLSKRNPPIIHRFSEDIDIKIEPWFDLKTGKNHDKDIHIEARRDFFNILTNQINIKGLVAKRNYEFDDIKLRNGGIDLTYKALFESDSNIKEQILLEVGFDRTTPNEKIDISSWAYDRAQKANVKIIDNRAKSVNFYNPEYTFVEKLQAISTKVRRQQEKGEFPANFLRHFYDLHKLYGLQRIKDFMKTSEYKAYKEERFPLADNLKLKENIAFNLDKNKELFDVYEEKFNKLKLFYDEKPTFSEIYESIINIKDSDLG